MAAQVPSIFSHLRHFVRQERRFVARQAVYFATVVSKQLLFRGETTSSGPQVPCKTHSGAKHWLNTPVL